MYRADQKGTYFFEIVEKCRKNFFVADLPIGITGGLFMGKKFFIFKKWDIGGPDPVQKWIEIRITELLDRARRNHSPEPEISSSSSRLYL